MVLWLDRGAVEGLSPTCGRAVHWGQLSALLATVLHAWQPWPAWAALGDSALVSLLWAQALESPCVKWAVQVTGLGRKAMLTAKRQEVPPQIPKGAQHKATGTTGHKLLQGTLRGAQTSDGACLSETPEGPGEAGGGHVGSQCRAGRPGHAEWTEAATLHPG